MPVKFKSKHSADIVMLDNVAAPLISMMGHSGSIPSSLAAEDVAGALEKLEQAVARQADSPLGDRAATTDTSEDDDNGDEGRPAVTVQQRAGPLLDMLRAALREGDFVIWDR